MADQWFVQRDGKKFGPMPTARLKQLAAAGKLQPTDLVQKEGVNKIVPASAVKGLFAGAAAHPQPSAHDVTPPVPLAQALPLDDDGPVSECTDRAARPLAQHSGKVPWVWVGVGSALLGSVVLTVGVIAASQIWNRSEPNPGNGQEVSQNGTTPAKDGAGSPTDGPISPPAGAAGLQRDDSLATPAGAAGPQRDGPPATQAGAAGPQRDDWLLWKAGITSPFTHNRTQFVPELPQQHAEVVNQYANGDVRHALFANTILAKDYVDVRHFELMKTDRKVQGQIPIAANRSAADAVLKGLLGREPTWREMLNEDVAGGFVDTVDRMRVTKLAISQTEIFHHLLCSAIAEQAEAHYRKLLGDRRLPDDARLFVEGNRSTVQISYAGKQPLKNVVVVTHAIMKAAGAQSVANAALIHGINELFDPGADRNKVAAQYIASSRILHETPQASFIYVPVLEPGDVLVVPVFEQGYFWDIKETRASFYADSGAVLDKVLMVGGPENDLSLTSAQRRAQSRPPVEDRPVGPAFDSGMGHVEIILKPEAAGSPFERCVPVGGSFLALAIKDALEAGKPLEVIARSDKAYVVLGPKKLTGRGLVLIPKDQVAQVNDLNKQGPAKQIERGIVQPVKQATWLLLKPQEDGSNVYQFSTCATLLRNICTKTGNSVELTVQPNELMRAVGTWDDHYVVFLQKPATDGSTIVLIHKSVVRELKTKK